jgi:hypothetical protein
MTLISLPGFVPGMVCGALLVLLPSLALFLFMLWRSTKYAEPTESSLPPNPAWDAIRRIRTAVGQR